MTRGIELLGYFPSQIKMEELRPFGVSAIFRSKNDPEADHIGPHYESVFCGCDGNGDPCPHCDGSGKRHADIASRNPFGAIGVVIYAEVPQ